MAVHDSNTTHRFPIQISGPMPPVPRLTAGDLDRAHRIFLARKPRDLFYKAATELVDQAFRGASRLTLAEAIAVVLQTWNESFYRHRKFDDRHFSAIESLLETHRHRIAEFRRRTIFEISDDDVETVKSLFHEFEMVLGPVGAAKALHLLAPGVFPLWDRPIADAYSHDLGRAGSNETRYWHFLQELRQLCANLDPRPAPATALKAIDEYNYCRHTKHWMQ